MLNIEITYFVLCYHVIDYGCIIKNFHNTGISKLIFIYSAEFRCQVFEGNKEILFIVTFRRFTTSCVTSSLEIVVDMDILDCQNY